VLLELQECLVVVVVTLAAKTVQNDLVCVAEVLEEEVLDHVLGVGKDAGDQNAGVIGTQVLLDNLHDVGARLLRVRFRCHHAIEHQTVRIKSQLLLDSFLVDNLTHLFPSDLLLFGFRRRRMLVFLVSSGFLLRFVFS
jgi:hypothetical protein